MAMMSVAEMRSQHEIYRIRHLLMEWVHADGVRCNTCFRTMRSDVSDNHSSECIVSRTVNYLDSTRLEGEPTVEETWQ